MLSQVLNNYDQETTDFYRWRVCYSQQELSELIHKRSGIEFGKIIDLIPVERGTSGRLVRLKIVGTLRTLIIGKELEIRRTLSSSHLYSSAFVVDKEYKEDEKEIPSRFILTGSGWGHGVGLLPDRCRRNGGNKAINTKKYYPTTTPVVRLSNNINRTQ